MEDSIYSPFVSTRVSPAEAFVTAALSVPEPGATLVVAACMFPAHASAKNNKAINVHFMAQRYEKLLIYANYSIKKDQNDLKKQY